MLLEKAQNSVFLNINISIMKRLSILLLPLFFCFQSCSKIVKDTIDGHVFDKQSSQALSGANVTLYEHHCADCLDQMMSVTTNEKGYFKIRDNLRRNDNYVLVASIAGYKEERIFFNEKDDFTDLLISLEK